MRTIESLLAVILDYAGLDWPTVERLSKSAELQGFIHRFMEDKK